MCLLSRGLYCSNIYFIRAGHATTISHFAFLLYSLWQLHLDIETLIFFEFFSCHWGSAVLRRRVVVVAKLNNFRMPSSTNLVLIDPAVDMCNCVLPYFPAFFSLIVRSCEVRAVRGCDEPNLYTSIVCTVLYCRSFLSCHGPQGGVGAWTRILVRFTVYMGSNGGSFQSFIHLPNKTAMYLLPQFLVATEEYFFEKICSENCFLRQFQPEPEIV